MRLVVANWNRGTAGGAERYLQSVIPELLRRGHEVAVLHRADAAPGQTTIDPPGAALATWSVDRLGVRGALDAMAGWRPGAVYSHGVVHAVIDEILPATYPIVTFAHNYDGTCSTGQKSHRFPVPRPCGRTFGPMCLVLHYPRRCGGLNPVRMLVDYRLQTRRRAALPQYHAVLVASRHMQRELSRHGVAPDRLHLVPLPFPGAAPDITPPIARPLSGIIMMAARLTKLKGADYLIRALPRAARELGRPLQLSLAGSGPDRAALEQLARALDVAATFHGWIDPERIRELMRAADLLAVPSVWAEPFGLVGVEAGCVGLPAVAFEVGGIPDWLVPGVSGELAAGDPPTVDGLSEAIVRAVRDPSRHAALRRGAWDMAGRFTMDAHMQRLEPLLERAATGRP